MIRQSAPVIFVLSVALLLFSTTACGPYTPPSLITRTSPDTVSIREDDTDIVHLLTNVAEVFSLELDLPGDLHGRTSLNLRDVTWRQIFKVTLIPVGYDFYEEPNGRIVIRRDEEIRQLPPITERFALAYQTPAATQAYLARFAPEVETRLVEGRLSVTAHPQQMPALRAELQRIDRSDVSLNRYTRPVYLPATIPHIGEIPKKPAPRNTPLSTVVLVAEKIDAFHLVPYIKREIERIPGANVQLDVRINALIVTSVESFEPRLRAIVTYLDDEKWYTPPGGL